MWQDIILSMIPFAVLWFAAYLILMWFVDSKLFGRLLDRKIREELEKRLK